MNSIRIGIIIFSFIACGTKNKTAVQNNSAEAEIKTENSSPAGKVTISGSVTQTNSYCGGARPPDFLLEELATPKPFPDKKFHVIKGETNTVSHKIILSFTTDTAGNFSFQLEPGTYSIILDEQASAPYAKKYKTQSQSIDEECYKNRWAKPYYLLEVEASSKTTIVKGLNFNFHKCCFINSDVPCLHYEEPVPP